MVKQRISTHILLCVASQMQAMVQQVSTHLHAWSAAWSQILRARPTWM